MHPLLCLLPVGTHVHADHSTDKQVGGVCSIFNLLNVSVQDRHHSVRYEVPRSTVAVGSLNLSLAGRVSM